MRLRLLPGTLALIVALLAVACGGSDKPSSSNGGPSASSGDSTPAASSTTAPASTPADGSSTTPPKASIEQLVLIQPNDNQTSVKLNNGQLTAPPPATSELKLNPSGDIGFLGPQALYKLSPAAEGGTRSVWVQTTLKFGNTELSRSTRIDELGKWSFNFPFGVEAHPPNGDYELTVKLLPNGDTKSAKFKVSGAPEAAAKLAPAILVSEGVIAKGTVFVSNFQDRAKTSFKPGDGIYLLTSVSTTTPVPSVLMTATWKRNGQQVGEPQVSISTLYEGLREFPFPGAKVPGDYEATVTVASTGESTKVAFKIEDGATMPGTYAQSGMVRNLGKDAEPDAKSFVTTADASDKLALAFTLAGSDAKGTEDFFTLKRTYEGTELPSFGTPDRRGTWYVQELDRSTSGPMPAGKYEVTVTNAVSNEKKTVAYTVSSTGKLPPPAAKITTANIGEITFNPAGTPTAAYKTTISPTAAAIAVYFAMDSKGGDSAIKAVWTLPGGQTVEKVSTDVVKAGAMQNFSLNPPAGGFVVGDYQVTLTVVTTGEVKQYKFAVK